MRSIWYLRHRDSDRRLGYYLTLAGARIAQRSRNRRLGFRERIERVVVGELEYERCWDSRDQVVDATWIIEEAVVDSQEI